MRYLFIALLLTGCATTEDDSTCLKWLVYEYQVAVPDAVEGHKAELRYARECVLREN